MITFVNLITLALALASYTAAFPAHLPLAGLSKEELDTVLPTFKYRRVDGPPPPIAYNGTKLVNDADHPYQAPGPGDMRGPCPGMNTLANHGVVQYIPRNGVATPAQMITGVQEGFNMSWLMAVTIVYAGILLDGNVVSNLLSIGGKTSLTGQDPPPPAANAGLDTHNLFEGDASMTRADLYFGDSITFNETLFDKLVDYSNQYGGGKYNYTVGAELRWALVQDGIADNPQFSFVPPRYITAYAESAFPVNFFVDGRNYDGQLDLDVARSFFKDNKMPDDFYRAPQPMDVQGRDIVINTHPLVPGTNTNGINTWTPNEDVPSFLNDPTGCDFYTYFVNTTIFGLYPNPTGDLLDAVNQNLDFFYLSTQGNCEQVFPYGQPQN